MGKDVKAMIATADHETVARLRARFHVSAGAHGRVMDLGDGVGGLDQSVGDAVPMLEEGGETANREECVLVDRCRENSPAVLAEPCGVVGAASKK